MIHVLIDTNIYLADRKRSKPAFRAVTRLAKAGSVQIHISPYIEREFVSHQHHDAKKECKVLVQAAYELLTITADPTLTEEAKRVAARFGDAAKGGLAELQAEFRTWMAEVNMAEHLVQPNHGENVMVAYFTAGTPFGSAKNRNDFPDAFIWQAALDLAQIHDPLSVVTGDKRMFKAAEGHGEMNAYASLDDFINGDECQDALSELASETVVQNIRRIEALLPTMESVLSEMLQNPMVNALAGRTVTHRSIRDDNNEGTISVVGHLGEIEFAFEQGDYYGDVDLTIPFTGISECLVDYAIYKGDYHILNDEESNEIGVSDLNDHYYDAEQYFTIKVEGTLSLTMTSEELENDSLSDLELENIVGESAVEIDIDDATVQGTGDY